VVPKVTTGAGLRGALSYDLLGRAGEPRGEWIGGTLIGSPREMSRQAAAFRALRPDCRKAIWRCSLSLPPRDGRVSAARWETLIKDFMTEMGIPLEAAWTAVRHADRDHDHVHFTLLRTLPDSTLWNQEHSARRAIKACQVLEERHQLSQHSRDPPARARITTVEREINNRTGKGMSRKIIQDAVDRAIKNHPGLSFQELQQQLAAEGIQAEAYAPKGRWAGVTYTHAGIKWAGSKLGTDYSPAGLTKRGLIYVETVDQDLPEEPTESPRGGPLAALKKQQGMPAQNAKRLPRRVEKQLSRTMQALSWLSQELVHLAKDLAALVWRFVKWILSKLGLNFDAPAAAEAAVYHQPELPAPVAFAAAPRALAAPMPMDFMITAADDTTDDELEQLDLQAAVQLGQLHDAIKQGDASLLPGQDQAGHEFNQLARGLENINTQGNQMPAATTQQIADFKAALAASRATRAAAAEAPVALAEDWWLADPEFLDFNKQLTNSQALANAQKRVLWDRAKASREALRAAMEELRLEEKIEAGITRFDQKFAEWEKRQQFDQLTDGLLDEQDPNVHDHPRPGM
jgi:hypothetical protein